MPVINPKFWTTRNNNISTPRALSSYNNNYIIFLISLFGLPFFRRVCFLNTFFASHTPCDKKCSSFFFHTKILLKKKKRKLSRNAIQIPNSYTFFFFFLLASNNKCQLVKQKLVIPSSSHAAAAGHFRKACTRKAQETAVESRGRARPEGLASLQRQQAFYFESEKSI